MTKHEHQDSETLLAELAAARDANQIAESTEQNVRRWLTDPVYSKYQTAVAEHIREKKFRELDDAFWAVLPFGTGGRRGKMYPIGTNVMNERTVGESAQGLAGYMRQALGESAELSCVIAYDTRNRSAEFARLSASVLAANGVRVFIFPEHRATPQLSFAVRELNATAGIVISASHNPPSDNGFKCSWSTGGQVLPPHDAGIIRCVEAVREIRSIPFDEAVARGLVMLLGPADDRAYIQAVASQSRGRHRNLRIVYTPLHGVGMTSVASVLDAAGFKDVHVVAEQAIADGNFPNVADHAPNPENPATLREAIELAKKANADLILASDPDADRIAAAVPNSNNQFVPLSGNQTAALLTHYVVKDRAASTPRGGQFVVKTLVTTDMITRIAESHGVETCGDLPVGFKWIADAIDRLGPDRFLFGAEESLGYLAGQYARDKDAAVAALLFAEMAAELKAKGSTVLGHLDDLYRRYGYHLEQAVSKSRPGREGAAQIARIMESLRTRPPEQVAGIAVARIHDHVTGEIRERRGDRPPEPIAGIRQQQVVIELDRAGWRLVARPSGTEPKIKFYLFGFVGPDEISARDLSTVKRDAAETMNAIAADLESVIESALRA